MDKAVEAMLNGIEVETGEIVAPDLLHHLKGIVGQIELVLSETKSRVLMLTSSTQHEGTTEVAAALGAVLAGMMKRKTLLIDCNPIDADLSHNLGGMSIGFSEYLENIATIDQVSHSTALKNLSVMPLGQKFTTLAAFDGHHIKTRIDNLREQHQYVLIDSAPVGSNPDMTLLCDKVDGVIIVVRYAVTRKEIVMRTKEIIERAGGRIIGVILNRRKFPIPRFLYDRI